jgi:tetratricopeptide (TPR) repeat protein
MGRYDQAIDETTQMLTRYVTVDVPASERAEAHTIRALSLLRLGRLPESAGDLAAASALDPKRSETLNAQGVHAGLAGKYREAGLFFRDALRTDPRQSDTACNLATLYLLADSLDEGATLYRFAEDRDPTCVPAVTGAAAVALARWLRLEGDILKAANRSAKGRSGPKPGSAFFDFRPTFRPPAINSALGREGKRKEWPVGSGFGSRLCGGSARKLK